MAAAIVAAATRVEAPFYHNACSGASMPDIYYNSSKIWYMSNYRLASKPGVVRTGRIMPTTIRPVISSRSTIVTTPSTRMAIEARVKQVAKPKQAAKEEIAQVIVQPVPAILLKEQRVLSVAPKLPKIIKRRSNNEHEKATKRADELTRKRRGQGAGSASRSRHERLLSQYRDKIENLKDSGKGKILAIIACGPSVLEADLKMLQNKNNIDIMSINKPDKRVWPSKFWVFCDNTQYNRNQELWNPYNGLIINPSSIRQRHPNQILVKNRGGKGFSKDLLNGYHIGRSSTYAAMQLAYWMGYKAYIFGLDMCAVEINGNKVLYHYGASNPDVADKNRMERFAIEATYYSEAADKLTKEERDRFVMCSAHNPWDFMNKFPRLDHKLAVAQILKETGNA